MRFSSYFNEFIWLHELHVSFKIVEYCTAIIGQSDIFPFFKEKVQYKLVPLSIPVSYFDGVCSGSFNGNYHRFIEHSPSLFLILTSASKEAEPLLHPLT